MCLAIPGKVMSIQDNSNIRIAKVSFGGILKEVSLVYVPEANVGDYVVVHVGFAISKLNEEEAHRTLEYLSEIGELEELKL